MGEKRSTGRPSRVWEEGWKRLRAARVAVAVLVGLLDRFEIWSPARHAAVEASDNVMAVEAFKMME